MGPAAGLKYVTQSQILLINRVHFLSPDTFKIVIALAPLGLRCSKMKSSSMGSVSVWSNYVHLITTCKRSYRKAMLSQLCSYHLIHKVEGRRVIGHSNSEKVISEVRCIRSSLKRGGWYTFGLSEDSTVTPLANEHLSIQHYPSVLLKHT